MVQVSIKVRHNSIDSTIWCQVHLTSPYKVVDQNYKGVTHFRWIKAKEHQWHSVFLLGHESAGSFTLVWNLSIPIKLWICFMKYFFLCTIRFLVWAWSLKWKSRNIFHRIIAAYLHIRFAEWQLYTNRSSSQPSFMYEKVVDLFLETGLGSIFRCAVGPVFLLKLPTCRLFLFGISISSEIHHIMYHVA